MQCSRWRVFPSLCVAHLRINEIMKVRTAMLSQTKAYRSLRIRLDRLIYPGNRMTLQIVELDGLNIIVRANEDVGRCLRVLKDFEPEESAYLRNLISPEDVCIDIGGNVGYFSMLMAQCASAGQVHVFEPIPLNSQIIRANALLNGFENVIVNPVALGDVAGSCDFSVSVDSAYSSLKSTGRKGDAASITVPIWTLDEYADEHGLGKIAVMKVDVEGAEEMVLRGATKLLSDPNRRPSLIMLELFDLNFAPFDTSVRQIVKRMQGLGYAANVLADGHSLSPFQDSMANVVPNVFFVI